MALNCPINNMGQPNKVEGEILIVYRDFVEIEVRMDGVGKRTAKGKVFLCVMKVYLSSLRMVFVNEKYQTEDFKSFDMPIQHLFAESVEMPIFGSTYLKGSVKPLFGLLPGNSHFKLWFYKGSTDTFIRFLSKLIDAHRKGINQQPQQNPYIQQMSSGNFDRKAFVDPDDPSVVCI
jgi:hypothetical protein